MHGIAGAFVATFWGVFLANGVFLPLANKLKQLSPIEVAHKMLIVEGIMAIQAGVSPRVVEELLKSHMPPSERDEVVVPPPAAEAPAAGRSRVAVDATHDVRRRDELPEEHEEHVNHEAWVIPYADLLTLLMAMFIALFAISTVDVSKFKDARDRVQRGARRRQARQLGVRGLEPEGRRRRSRATATATVRARAAASSRATTSSPRRSSRSC